jgi:LemA protein
MKVSIFSLALAFSMGVFSGCGVQSIPQSKNDVDAALAETTNQYKRRADLIPNLVEAVRGFAKQEKEVLVGVTEARAHATQVTLDPKNYNAADLEKYQKAQGQLSQALGKLLMVTENYPQLKSDQNFRDLQAQLEGTENRIAVARERYIVSIKQFNNLVAVPPTSWTNSIFYKYEKMPQWDAPASENVQKAPEVKF